MVNDNKNLQQFHSLVSKISDRLGQQNLAITMMVIANLLWPICFLYVSQHHFSPYQTNLIRGTAICVTHLLIGTYLGIPLSFKTWKQFKYLMIRNTLMVLHQLFYTAMHFVLSFPLINSIVITGPIFVFAIDYYINGITINRVQIIGMVVAFLGIFININGDILMSFIDPSFQITSTYEHYEVTDIKTKVMYSLLAMMMNVLWGYAVVSQKIIKHVSGLQISYFLGVQFVFSSAICSNLGLVTPVTLSESLTACLLSGLLMAFCQLLFISGLNLSKNAGKMSILILLYAIPAYAISFFKFDEEINIISLLGLVFMGFGLYRTVFGADK